MIRKFARVLSQLATNQGGAVVVETAIVAPVLVLMALGTFEVSRMIAKQSDLQAGSVDAEGIVLAVANGTATDLPTIKAALVSSLGLSANDVSVGKVYRCNDNSTLLTTVGTTCSGTNDVVSTYLQITLTDTYRPLWTNFGVGSPLSYRVSRTVQVS